MSGIVEQVLQAMADANNGLITPSGVVDAARALNHPLHEHFEWNDSIAAERHREAQARALIRSVTIEVRTTRFTVQAPAFVRDPTLGSQQGYRPVARLRTDEDAAREAVIQEMARASAAIARAKAVGMVLGMEEEIDRVEAGVLHLVERVRQQEAYVEQPAAPVSRSAPQKGGRKRRA
jgi:hypothetical protein